jgi:ankyrin repeat protein
VYVSTLAAAVANGHGEFIDALVEAGADVNAHDLALGTALISSARRSGSSRTYKLLDLGADPYLTGGRWGSAIHAAAQVGNPSVVKRLLDAGVSPNFVAGRYGPVLQAACNPQGDVDYLGCVRLLLARGADVNARGGKYETGLQCAAKHGKLDAVRELLEHGADPRIEGGKYGTAENAAKELKHWHVWNYLHRYARQNHSAA